MDTAVSYAKLASVAGLWYNGGRKCVVFERCLHHRSNRVNNLLRRLLTMTIIPSIPQRRRSRDRVARAGRDRLKFQALVRYSGFPPRCQCEGCTITEREFLAIDHLAGTERRSEARSGHHLYWWLYKNEYPSGFRVLCHNCNMAYGLYGYCPHQSDTVRQSQLWVEAEGIST